MIGDALNVIFLRSRLRATATADRLLERAELRIAKARRAVRQATVDLPYCDTEQTTVWTAGTGHAHGHGAGPDWRERNQ